MAAPRLLVVVTQLAIAALIVYRVGDFAGWWTSPHARVHAALVNAGLFKPRGLCGLYNATEFVLIADRTVIENELRWAGVHVRNGVIVNIYNQSDALPTHLQSIHYPHNTIMGPGLIDIHVHMNEPGREEWEGMTTATMAAAAGGITTVIDMPLNSFPTTTNAARVREKIAIARRKAHVDVGFWGGLVPDNAHDRTVLLDMLRAGALGFKAFMHPSGINDFEHVNVTHIASAIKVARDAKVPILLHAEDARFGVDVGGEDGRKYATWLKSHPRAMEKGAVRAMLALLAGVHPGGGHKSPPLLHVVHLSDAELLGELQEARAKGAPLTVETCTQYLRFAAEDVADSDLRFKCAPPIREGSNRQALWGGIRDGVIDVVASDHSPAPPSMKQGGDFMAAWGGIAGLQFGLPATWDGLRGEQMDAVVLHRLWGAGPARVAGLVGRKGALAVGADADVVVWQDDAAWTVTEGDVLHRWKKSAFVGERFVGGRVVATWVRGSQVYKGGEGVAREVCGGVVLRGGGGREGVGGEL